MMPSRPPPTCCGRWLVEVPAVADHPRAVRRPADHQRRPRRLIRYLGGVTVQEIDGNGLTLDNGITLGPDYLLAATGVTPNSAVAEKAALVVDQSRIVVGADMRTSVDGVFAAGDVALAFNATAGRHLTVEHWQDAMDQGEVAGLGAAGGSASWDGVPGFWRTIGDTTIKYHAWGDDYQRSKLVVRDDGFTVWYESDRAVVGVLTCNADDDYDLGEALIAEGRPATGSAGLSQPKG